MASNDRVLSTGISDLVNEDKNANSANVQDQVLLKALQDFIVPLIRAVGHDMNQTNEINLGPEAGKLITALQEFISNILMCSQSKVQNTIEVGIVDSEGSKETELQVVKLDDDADNKESYAEFSSPPELLSLESEGPVGNNDSENQDTSEKATFQNKLLSALREHVFNTMPIRLLCFEPHGSTLRITLAERGSIYQRLESMLRANMHQGDYLPQKIVDLDTEAMVMETQTQTINRLISKYARYAILSHTWLRTSREVTFGDWNNGRFDTSELGYQKLVNFCQVAWKNHGLIYGWMDTVCINKESSSELDESIRSMYEWYRRASVCIIYLAETMTLSNMAEDPWFTRGWTLQELLAPKDIRFYNRDWNRLVNDSENDRDDARITDQIEQATTISKDELDSIFMTPISRRMQWAATRDVTREEDTAYSLMGIFDVSISTAYGEGSERAFYRLLQEILVTSASVLDIFNWAGQAEQRISSILPSSPMAYLRRSSNEQILLDEIRPMEPLTLTHLGLRIPVLLLPALSIVNSVSQYVPIGDYSATIDIEFSDKNSARAPSTVYNLLDSRIYSPESLNGHDSWHKQLMLAVFNFTGDAFNAYIPITCIAKGLYCSEDVGKVTPLGNVVPFSTEVPIVFDLSKRTTVDKKDPADDSTDYSYFVRRDELGKHGMQLVSLYF